MDIYLHGETQSVNLLLPIISRLTIVNPNRETKKKQAICNEQVSYLHALKFANALNKLP